MDADGQRVSSNPSAMLTTLVLKRTKLQEELRNIEKQNVGIAKKARSFLCVVCNELLLNVKKRVGRLKNIVHEMETSYLQDPSQCGNVLKGFEGFLSSSKSTTLLKRSRKFQPEDRLFSLSSVTSPAAEENTVGRDDSRPDFGAGRFKSGGALTNAPGKPKKGRAAGPRDTKRIRPSSEADYDYEDDPDLIP